jgi:hypothetical protein
VVYMDVAKVDRYVAHVAVVVHVCCKHLFQMFHLFFSSVRCKCVSFWMLHMFHTYVASVYLDVVYVLQRLFQVFLCFL